MGTEASGRRGETPASGCVPRTQADIWASPIFGHFSGLTQQRPAIHSGGGEIEMPQYRRRDVDERRTLWPDPGEKTAAGDEQERALLVAAEPAMLAEAGAIFRLERVANDVAVTGHTVRIGAVVRPEGQGDLRRRSRRQADLGEVIADENAADP